MNQVAVGIDVESVERISRSTRRERFLDVVYTSDEKARIPGGRASVRYLAILFSLKESLLKAVGTGITDTQLLQEISIRLCTSGQACMECRGRLRKHMIDAGWTQIKATYSCNELIVLTQVLLSKE